jgi:hypothetical protein
MTVSWPFYKREELFQELTAILLLPSSRRHLMPKQTASILGKLRSASQFVFFARWLDQILFTQQSAAALTNGQTIKLLGTYLSHLRHGVTLQQSSSIVTQTLCGYVSSAANVLTVITQRPCLIYDPATMHQRHQPSYHPFLKEQLTQHAAWGKPKDRIEPFTASMFNALFEEIQSSSDPLGTFISPLHAIFDWTRLGLFTGSCLRKYGQSRH